MFLLSHLWAKILFDSGASHSFVAASSVRIDQICRDCELEISGILLTVDLRVMVSDFDVILSMDWLTTHRVIIDCDSRRITAYTRDSICVTFQGEKHYALP